MAARSTVSTRLDDGANARRRRRRSICSRRFDCDAAKLRGDVAILAENDISNCHQRVLRTIFVLRHENYFSVSVVVAS